jgi:hypothetical protein
MSIFYWKAVYLTLKLYTVHIISELMLQNPEKHFEGRGQSIIGDHITNKGIIQSYKKQEKKIRTIY